ncbi:MAG: LolD [uncultured bacterium]|nr:MAG: LolD [uncultured bacterium]
MTLTDKKPIIVATNLAKKFTEGKLYVEVLRGINLEVKAGEMIAIVGPSGSGKSTLLHLLGGLDSPTAGKVEVNGINVHELSEKAKGELRNKYLGFIYQFHHLLPEFSALENVAIPLLIGGAATDEAKHKAREILAKVGLAKRERHRIGELSGGERQRVAIARALVTNPKCVLADEPTGNLDQKTALQIYEMIIELNREFKTAFVIVTHDLTIAHKMQRMLVLEDGRFVNRP